MCLFTLKHRKEITSNGLLTGQDGGGLVGGSGRGLGAAGCCKWVLVSCEGKGGGPDGGGGAWFRLCSDLKGGRVKSWGECCLWGEVTGWIWGWTICSFCSAAYAGTGGGLTAGRTIACLDRVWQDGLGRGEDFPCGRMQRWQSSVVYCNIQKQ